MINCLYLYYRSSNALTFAYVFSHIAHSRASLIFCKLFTSIKTAIMGNNYSIFSFKEIIEN